MKKRIRISRTPPKDYRFVIFEVTCAEEAGSLQVGANTRLILQFKPERSV